MSGNEVWVTGFSDIKGQEYASLGSNLNGAVDASSGATALGDLASTLSVSTSDPIALGVTESFASDGAFSLMNAFLGFVPGSVGETSCIDVFNWSSTVALDWYSKLENNIFIFCRWLCNGFYS